METHIWIFVIGTLIACIGVDSQIMGPTPATPPPLILSSLHGLVATPAPPSPTPEAVSVSVQTSNKPMSTPMTKPNSTPSMNINMSMISTTVASTVPIGDPNCTDTVNCLLYGHASCTGPYAAWAHQHCSAFCGFCTPITTPFICQDNITNCHEYGADLCTKSSFIPFVQKNCVKYCHLCPGDLTTPLPKTGCFDDFEKCDEFGKSTCTKYPSWSKIYCQKYCNFCESNVTEPTTVTTTPGTTTPAVTHNDDCFDLQDCSRFDIKTACCGQYEAFSRFNCAAHCKFCTPKVTPKRICTDAIPNCDQYNSDLCTNKKYEGFAKEKCAGYCKLCEKPDFVPDCAKTNLGPSTTPTTTMTPTCTKDGQMYSKGETWNSDDCIQSCTCQDPDANQISCQPLKCPVWKEDCEMIYVPGECCPSMECNYLNTVHGERTQEELNALLGK